MNDKPTISVATSCYNEVENIPEFYRRVLAVLVKYPQYDYEFVVADNCSIDGTRDALRAIAAKDNKFKVIMNANNFGHIRSPYNALLNTSGDIVLYICSDLQEPPEILEKFLKKYDEGYKVICGVKPESEEFFLMFQVRKFYYWLLGQVSNSDLVRNFTGFGLYDKKFIESLRKYNESYPYFRGLVSDIGFKRCEVPYIQERRKFGRTKNNYSTLYDMAMTGFVNHTKLPLRFAVFCGFCLAMLSLLIATGYFIYKLIYWDTFSLGLAPLVIGLFFFSAVQLVFIGILGEYIGAIWTQVKNRPLIIEEERINFND